MMHLALSSATLSMQELIIIRHNFYHTRNDSKHLQLYSGC